jgi:mannose-1-phosphate guanylyltransferase
MEKADNIYTIAGSFGWDDVGSWLAVERINETDEDKNYIEGNVISIGSQRSTICAGKRLIAAVGVEDLIVVDTGDTVLICSKNNTQDVKKVIAKLKEQGRNELV